MTTSKGSPTLADDLLKGAKAIASSAGGRSGKSTTWRVRVS
jgi:hypothetical protein